MFTRIKKFFVGIAKSIWHSVIAVWLLVKAAVLAVLGTLRAFVVSIGVAFQTGFKILQDGLVEVDVKAQEVSRTIEKTIRDFFT